MAWLDDRAWCHPKWVNLSDRAYRVCVNSIAYSAGMGLRGILTPQQQALMGATRSIRAELEDCGLWDALNDNKIYIHDWDEHNGKRDARRAADRERKRAERRQERPQDSPQDAPQERRALKVVKEVTESSKELSRKPDKLWEALVDELGEPTTKSERGSFNAALKQLREVEATPDDVRKRCKAYRREWPEIALTPPALVKHWTRFASKPTSEPRSVEEELDLPELSDEERARNLERIQALTNGLTKEPV